MSDNVLRTAVKGLIVRDRRLLMLHTSQSEIIPGVWEFPGGKMHFGEELEDALLREVREETGLTVSVERLLYATTFFTRPWRQLVILTYRCTASEGDVTLSDEHDDWVWADRETVREQVNPPILEDFDRHGVLESLEID